MVFNVGMESLKTYVREIGLKATATALSVSVQRLSNWTERGVPVDKCVAVERATNGRVTRKDLRPDDWQEIWPELAPAHAERAQAATETVAGGV